VRKSPFRGFFLFYLSKNFNKKVNFIVIFSVFSKIDVEKSTSIVCFDIFNIIVKN